MSNDPREPLAETESGRVYLGDHAEGRARIWVVNRSSGPAAAEVVAVLRELSELNAIRPHLAPRGTDFEARRQDFLARKNDLIARIEAAERSSQPELIVSAETSVDWADGSDGTAWLATTLLSAELGEIPSPALCRKFSHDVVADLPRYKFELPATRIKAWMTANRDLVEAELYLDPLSPRPEPDHPAQAVTSAVSEPSTHEHEPEPERDEAVASELVRACEQTWRAIQENHPEIPDAVMVLGSGVERGRLVKLGHWWGGRWLADGQVRPELLLAGEALHLPPAQVFEVLLHEAAHGLSSARGMRDTSRDGRYHNEKFANAARELGLKVTAMPPNGLARTTLLPETAERYERAISALGHAMRIARHLGTDIQIGDSAGQGADGNQGVTRRQGDHPEKRGGRRVGASCGCGRRMLMAPSVLSAGPVVCGLCDLEFTPTPTPVRPREPERSRAPVVDHSFLDRRRQALDHDAGPPDRGGHDLPPAGQAGAMGRHPAALSQQDLAAIDAIVEQNRPAAGLGGAELAKWHQRWCTDEEQVLVGSSPAEVARLNQAARALLAATGELRGPTVVLGEQELRAGDRIVVGPAGLRPRPGGDAEFPTGMLGVVEAVAGDGAWLEIDFAMDGRARFDSDELGPDTLGYAYAVPATDLAGDPGLRSIHLAPVAEVEGPAALDYGIEP